MSTYVIGDVQGCLTPLKQLLNKVKYDPQRDHIQFVGDLVNRGPDSLETLRFIQSLSNTTVVLGNHDLHLLALYHGAIQRPSSHCLHSIIKAPDCRAIISWLQQQPLLHYNKSTNTALVHAGIPPQWTIEQALVHAKHVETALCRNPKQFLKEMYGNEPKQWHDDLDETDHFRYIINALTRMRFCEQDGTLNLTNSSSTPGSTKEQAWFQWYQQNTTILFGHWASLRGQSTNPNCIALDTGCVWGDRLTAYCIESKTFFSVGNPQPDHIQSKQ